MHYKKSKKSKHILTVVLASLVVLTATSAAVMTGCGENSESTNETKVVTETELVTVAVDVTNATDANGNTVSAENVNSKTSSNENGGNSSNGSANNNNSGNSSNKNNNNNSNKTSNKNSNSNNTASKNNSSNNSSNKNNNGNNSSNNNNNNGNSANNSNNNNNSESSNIHKPVTDSNYCNLDGHKYAVGDTVTCVYKLSSPEVLENYQAYISYDTKYLSVKSARLDGPAKSGGLLNFKLNGKIKFNGSNISSGYDYTDKDNFVIVNYVIKATGSTTPSFKWEVATGESKKAYVSNNKPANGLKITKEYS